LVEARQKLYNLLAKLDGNDKLEELLQDVLANSDKLEALGKAAAEKDNAPEQDSE
jgi:type VI secretion system protein ImpB